MALHLIGRFFTPVKIAVLLFHLALYLGWLGFTIYTYQFKSYSRKADAVIVIDSGVIGDEPTPQFKENLKQAALIYRNGFARNIIITGGRQSASGYTTAQVGKAYIIQFGIYPNDLLTEDYSRSIYQNLFYAKKVSDRTGFSSFIVVGEPLRMKRTMMYAKELGMYAEPFPAEIEDGYGINRDIDVLLDELYRYNYHLIMENLSSLEKHPEHF